MIEVAQGSPGSGKSAVAVARAILHLKRGGVVAANFSLVDGWAEAVVRSTLLFRFLNLFRFFCQEWLWFYVYKRATCLHKRFFRVDSLSAIRQIDPLNLSVGLYRNKGGFSEGEGLLILDECQLVFNARKWEKNFDWIVFFTQHRKLHWDVVLIAHSIEMIDSQVRPLAEYSSTFRNMQKLRVPILGLPMSPIPLFIVIKKYAGLGAGATVVHSRDLYPLPLWAARLYDSLLVFNAEDWGKDTEPHNCGVSPVIPDSFLPRKRNSVLYGPHWDKYLQTQSVFLPSCHKRI